MLNSVKRLRDMEVFMRGKVDPSNCRAGQNNVIIRLDGSLAPCFLMYSVPHETKRDIIPARAGILRGGKPFLSVEITRECPLRCPGCCACDPESRESVGSLANLSDLKGEALVARGIKGLKCLAPQEIACRRREEKLPWLNLNRQPSEHRQSPQ